MCRHLGYLGSRIPVGEIVTRGEHSLFEQSWDPRDMRRGGRINADGFGVAWWRAGQVTCYRNAAPIWTDPAVTEVLPQLESTAVLAAVRSATVGMPIERTACAPFTDDHWAFSLNGKVPNWRTVLPALAGNALVEMESATDTAALWVALLARLRDEPPEFALKGLMADVLTASPDSRLNLLLGDGTGLWASTWTHSLSVLVGEGGEVLIASEPYDDDPRWQPIPDKHLVTAQDSHVTITPLDI